MGEAEMMAIAAIIGDVLSNPRDEKVHAAAKEKVADLCQQFPLYA
jgi:glycine/serine hydroxymethyltransferase